MKVLIIFLTIIGTILAAKLPIEEQLIEEEVIIHKPYNFGFEVRDDETTNYQNRAEVADELGRVTGSYSYVLPDNFVYTVTYEDNKDGKGIKLSVKKQPSGITVKIPEQKPQDKQHNLVRKGGLN